MIVKTYISVE